MYRLTTYLRIFWHIGKPLWIGSLILLGILYVLLPGLTYLESNFGNLTEQPNANNITQNNTVKQTNDVGNPTAPTIQIIILMGLIAFICVLVAVEMR